jgi:hypothetical protein
MNGNLGRDKVWTPEIWADIDKAVTAEVRQVRAAQKVFPTLSVPNAQKSTRRQFRQLPKSSQLTQKENNHERNR